MVETLRTNITAIRYITVLQGITRYPVPCKASAWCSKVSDQHVLCTSNGNFIMHSNRNIFPNLVSRPVLPEVRLKCNIMQDTAVARKQRVVVILCVLYTRRCMK